MTDEHPNTVDQMFLDIGYRKAGGSWGNAQWRMSADGNVLVSLFRTDKFLQAPAHEDKPCMVIIHIGPFHPDWLDKWKIDDGHLEPPQHLNDGDDNITSHLFPSLPAALLFCASLKLSQERKRW